MTKALEIVSDTEVNAKIAELKEMSNSELDATVVRLGNEQRNSSLSFGYKRDAERLICTALRIKAERTQARLTSTPKDSN
jgi:hypothetical protein